MSQPSLKEAFLKYVDQLPEDVSTQELLEAVRTVADDLQNSEVDNDTLDLLRRRIEELDSGKVKGVPAEEVLGRRRASKV